MSWFRPFGGTATYPFTPGSGPGDWARPFGGAATYPIVPGGGPGDFLPLDPPPFDREDDHVGAAQARYICRLNQARNRAMVAALVRPLQFVEDTIWQVMTRVLCPENAEGVNLDIIGKWVGLERAGWDDVEYLRRIRVQQLVLRSNGRTEELIAIADAFELLSAVGGSVAFREHAGPACLVATVFHDFNNPPRELFLLLYRAKAAGVTFHLLYPGTTNASMLLGASVASGVGGALAMGNVAGAQPADVGQAAAVMVR